MEFCVALYTIYFHLLTGIHTHTSWRLHFVALPSQARVADAVFRAAESGRGHGELLQLLSAGAQLLDQASGWLNLEKYYESIL